MNKTKKIAVVAVSLVMAGTLAVSLTACGGGNTNTPKKGDISTPEKVASLMRRIAPQYETLNNAAWKGLYDYYLNKDPNAQSTTVKPLTYTSGTAVNVAIGYNSKDTAITFSTEKLIGEDELSSVKLPDGKTYQKGSLKPIWQSYQTALDITVNDKWPVGTTTLPDCVQQGLQNYDLIGAGSLSDIQTQIDAGTLLNLAEYMEYMPHLRQFLQENALAELGTINNVQSGSVYYSPYYAGMNDAERYNLFRTDYVSELLDYANLSEAATKNGGTITFKAQADKKIEMKVSGRQGTDETINGTKGSVEAYMGTTGSWTVKTTDPANPLNAVFVKVNYDAAKTAAQNSTSGLGKAIKDAAGKDYDGASGNIVDLQNFVINEKAGDVKGEHLLNILREYIKVAYEWSATETGTYAQFYGAEVNGVQTKLSDLFNATWAAWDVDTYAAIGRCFVTCGNFLGKYQSQASQYTNYGASTWLLTTRTGKLDRLTRQTAMIGELYGVRGLESMTYLDSSGTLRQARFNVATWDAMQKFSAFHTEGLVPSFYDATKADSQVDGAAGNQSIYKADNKFQALSSNDFIHTQATLKVPSAEEDAKKYGETTDGYSWTGIATPVSRWLTNDTSSVDADTNAITVDFDGKLSERPANKTTIMRFTESALKLKTGGLVIPKVVANDANKLHATLALMDYIYSNDGQIVTTFGDISTTDNLTGDATDGYTTTNNGWWYGKEVTSLVINGTATDISTKTMEELKDLGVVKTYDGKQYSITDEYASQALVYKNKLYVTGTDSAANGGDATYDEGYLYQGVMTPYYTRAVRELCNGKKVNNYQHSGSAWSSTNLQNLVLGAESHGIINNAGMVQLCNDMAVKGFSVISTILGNETGFTVKQSIGSNPWFTCAPNVTLPKSASDIINGYTDFTTLYATKAGGATLSNYLFTEVAWYGANAKLDSWSLSASTLK